MIGASYPDWRDPAFELGVFLPTVTRGYVPSHTAPAFEPTWPNVLDIARRAEEAGFDSALVMSKFRGPHGGSDYWDESLESFTLTGALLASTRRMRVYATAGIPAFAPAIVAKMGATLAAIGPGRFGLNVVTGWNPEEYEQMGLWPGGDYFARRYEIAAEYVSIIRELWQTGRSSFQGRHFRVEDCECTPAPGAVPIVTAGTSEAGLAFAAEHADVSFATGATAQGAAARLAELAAGFGRRPKSYQLVMVVIAETDELARERAAHLNEATDHEAMRSRRAQASRNPEAGSGTGTATRALHGVDAIDLATAWIGSPATIRARLEALRGGGEVGGVMLQFEDWGAGLDLFGRAVLGGNGMFRGA